MAVTGRGAFVPHPGADFEIVELEFDDPGHGEVLVKLVASGLCHTDIGIQASGLPFELPGILGHEGAGVVEKVGPGVTDIAPGDHVLLSFTFCGECRSCQVGHPAYCDTWFPRNVLGGLRGPDSGATRLRGEPVHSHFMGQSSFAEYSIADARSVVKVPADTDLVTLSPLGCGVITGVGSMWNVLQPQETDAVVVYGVGGVGLSGIWAAAQRKPAMLIAVDMVASRLELARKFGATHTIDASAEDVPARLRELTGGRGVDKSMDTTANPNVGSQALESTANAGTVLVVGVARPGTMLPVEMTGLINGKVLRGVTLGDARPSELIPELMGYHARGEFPLEILQQRYSLDEINDAAHDMHAGTTVKPIIVF